MARKSTTKRDEQEKTVKTPKGFYCLVERTYGTHRTNGYRTFAHALYETRRYWSKQPYTKGVSIKIEDKLLYTLDVATGKETFMSEFDDFRRNYVKKAGHDMDSLPSLKADDRKIFIRVGFPFRLGKETQTVDGGASGASIVYRIKVDTTSPEYQAVGTQLGILSEYNFWVKANEARTAQYNQILQHKIETQPDKLYILVKPEDTKDLFDFQFYTPGRPIANAEIDFDPFMDEALP